MNKDDSIKIRRPEFSFPFGDTSGSNLFSFRLIAFVHETGTCFGVAIGGSSKFDQDDDRLVGCRQTEAAKWSLRLEAFGWTPRNKDGNQSSRLFV